MTYQVLARKWRPKDFASLVGQEHVVRALTHALDGARLHHAYLFTGTRGVGKTTLSRIFAKALNCETGITATPCGVCRACREIDEGRFVDYVEMDAASNRGVDEMAALLERAVYAPVDARFKVYMIDEVHMLTNHAFNAMLKTLEEPPPHIKFILATTDPQKIPVTVLSRCLQFNLKQMPAGHIVSHLERILAAESVPFEPQALRLLARAADGSMRDALSLTDQAIAYSASEVSEEAVRGMLGALDQSYLTRLLDAVVAGDGALVLSIADEMALRSLSFSTALQDLAGLLHRVAWAQFAPASVLDEWPEAADVRRFAEALTPESVQLFYQIATIGRAELGLAPDEYAGFTMTLLRMLAFEPAGPDGSGGPGGGSRRRGGEAASAPGASRREASPVSARSAPSAQAAAPADAGSSETRALDRPAPRPAVSAADAPAAASVASHAAAPGARDVGGEASVATREAKPDAPVSAHDAHEPAPVQRMAGGALTAAGEAPRALGGVPAGDAEAGARARTQTSERGAPAPDQAAVAPRVAPLRSGGASAALDVLRNAGMRVSTGRTSGDRPAGATARPSPAAAPKPPVPRAPIVVPEPRPRAVPAAAPRTDAPSAPPPWDDMPPLDARDDYIPLSSEDDYFSSPLPDAAFDGSMERSVAPRTAMPRTPAVDLSALPPPIPLDAIGFAGDWPSLAVELGLTGIAHQLAFNSELTALDGQALKLSVPVPQYADTAQVTKLKAALAERLGRAVDVIVEVGPASRTAATLDAAARAERQRAAEREIDADPFVQSLIRDFGASIVPGSVKPLSPDTGAGAR